HQLLLFNLPKLDSKTSKEEWFILLEKKGVSIPIWPINDHKTMAEWIFNRAKSYQLKLNLALSEVLAHYVEGNSLAADQALYKLSLLNEREIDQQLLAAHMPD